MTNAEGNVSLTGAEARAPERAAARLRALSAVSPRLALVLGSGFHHLESLLRVVNRVPYARLGIPPTGVAGHSGELLLGHMGDLPVLALSGRTHYYEGEPLSRVTFAVRVLASFGIRDLLLTNAAGGIRRTFRRGDFMAFKDHINLMGDNPLRGPTEPRVTRFVDMTATYDPDLRQLLQRAARRVRVRLHSGVYLAVSGPSYETPAEIRAFRALGADAVGMSTVPEAIVARQCGLRVAALSCITNRAAGLSRAALSHARVLEAAQRSGKAAAQLLGEFVRMYGHSR